MFQDLPLHHQLRKSGQVLFPISRFNVSIADFRAGGKDGLVVVDDSGDLSQEEGQIGIFGKARQLADAVLPDIDQLLHLRLLQKAKELLRRLLGETDREQG